MFPSESKKEHLRSIAGADALVDELMAPYLGETKPMKLRREREEARQDFMRRVDERATGLSPREPAERPGPTVLADSAPEAPAVPAPYQMHDPLPAVLDLEPDADAKTLQAAIVLGLVEDDEEP